MLRPEICLLPILLEADKMAEAHKIKPVLVLFFLKAYPGIIAGMLQCLSIAKQQIVNLIVIFLPPKKTCHFEFPASGSQMT